MSDTNLAGDDTDAAAPPAPNNGSSSESSDISIEKLNADEPDAVVEDKPTEENKVTWDDNCLFKFVYSIYLIFYFTIIF